MTTWVLDLDGVLWLGVTPIPGSVDAVARLRAAGHRVAFCTNNSSTAVGDYVEKLTRLGVSDVETHDVVTSSIAAASLLGRGERVLVCAGTGARESAVGAGAAIVEPAAFDDGSDSAPVGVVLVGFHRTFDYVAMRAAVRAVLGGARLVATNDDPIFPDSDGPAPGCGSILASIERGSGIRAVVAGKPNQPMADVLVERFGSDAVFVGDTLDTDGAMAAALGWPFGLVLSGNVKAADVPPDHDPAWVAPDLATLVTNRLAR